jgi:hypothetical protein
MAAAKVKIDERQKAHLEVYNRQQEMQTVIQRSEVGRCRLTL